MCAGAEKSRSRRSRTAPEDLITTVIAWPAVDYGITQLSYHRRNRVPADPRPAGVLKREDEACAVHFSPLSLLPLPFGKPSTSGRFPEGASDPAGFHLPAQEFPGPPSANFGQCQRELTFERAEGNPLAWSRQGSRAVLSEKPPGGVMGQPVPNGPARAEIDAGGAVLAEAADPWVPRRVNRRHRTFCGVPFPVGAGDGPETISTVPGKRHESCSFPGCRFSGRAGAFPRKDPLPVLPGDWERFRPEKSGSGPEAGRGKSRGRGRRSGRK